MKTILLLVSILSPLFSVKSTLNSKDCIKKLSDSKGNTYSLIEKEMGYQIIDNQTNIVVEENNDGTSPYADNDSNLKYFGPMEYYVEKNDSYEHLITHNIISKNSEFVSLNIETNENSNIDSISEGVPVFNSTTYTNVANYSILSTIENYAYNENGTCGYLAACICLYYFHEQWNNKFILSEYMLGKGFTKSFQDKLLNIGYSLGLKNVTIASDIAKVLNQYSKDMNLSFTCSSTLLSSAIKIDSNIKANKPVIIFGRFVNPSSGSKVNHALVMYGYKEENFIGGNGSTSTNRYLRVNYGWGNNYRDVYILDSIFTNPIGSTVYFGDMNV